MILPFVSLWLLALFASWENISILPRCFAAETSSASSTATHTSNHAVIVSSSRYWFNYRHTTNALSIYQLLKRNGIPDDNIVLMLADEYAINDRNVYKNRLLTKGRTGDSIYDSDTQIDYRGDDVSVDNFLRVLRGQPHESSLPVLQSNQHSHVLIYLTGHGGNQFFKFQDVEEITSQQLARAVAGMHERSKYQEVLIVADTCQAYTLADHMEQVPNVTIIASSLKGESSYAHHVDGDLGLSVTERYTAAMVDYLKAMPEHLQVSLQQGLVDPYPFRVQRAHIGANDASAVRKLDEALVSEFFANVETNGKVVEEDVHDDWMAVHQSPHRFVAPVRTSRTTNVDSTQHAAAECLMQDGPSDNGATAAVDDEIHSQPAILFPGMEPTDPMFLTWTALFVGAIAWMQQRLK
ncbi:hypothetical protein MPSEU_000061300 [Mayamaea pseudoterrestris]|nr:hypothetical protein MPSEU_000061300 [Mayamaea pseudoterrestris]